MDPRKQAEKEETEKNYLLKLFVKTKRLIDDRLKGRNHTNRNARQSEMLVLKAKKFLHGGKNKKRVLWLMMCGRSRLKKRKPVGAQQLDNRISSQATRDK